VAESDGQSQIARSGSSGVRHSGSSHVTGWRGVSVFAGRWHAHTIRFFSTVNGR
jgi:hypothetical protein